MSATFEEYSDNNKPITKNCKSCRYFCPYVYDYSEDESGDWIASDYGECRRFPPRAVAAEEIGFPVVLETSWCGEFDI